jgi:general stress protein 26
MDSINRNQPEQNRDDLSGSAAVEKIKEIVGRQSSCFFCTATPLEGSPGARPMNVLKVDDFGSLWFLSSSDSHKNQDLEVDPGVTLYFQASPYSGFMQLNGRTRLSRDRSKIEELWQPLFKTWFTAGIDDPRITVIEFVPTDGYYWDTKHGLFVAGLKMVVGAMTGQTLDDSVEGTLAVGGRPR